MFNRITFFKKWTKVRSNNKYKIYNLMSDYINNV